MNYGQLKNEIRDLGFSDSAEMTAFGDIVPNSINRAITQINLKDAPIIAYYTLTQNGTETGLQEYDIEDLTKVGNVVRFLEFADTPIVEVSDTEYRPFTEYQIENNTLILDGSLSTTLRVFYKKSHTMLASDTEDSTELELPTKAHHLVPLLASYYIWLEDENSKAVAYYNEYEKEANYMKERKQRKISIGFGGI